MIKLKYKLLILLGIGVSLISSNANALPATVDTINLIGVSDIADPTTNLLNLGPYDATKAVGVYIGENDDQWEQSNPENNIGEKDDGLLNGEGFFTGLEFIDTSMLQDIDGDTIKTDPGWIHLAHVEPGRDPEVIYDVAGPNPYNVGDTSYSFNIGEILTLTFVWPSDDAVGTWELETTEDGWEKVNRLLGSPTFDHLAFSFKAGNAFAVYDFDFNYIFGNELLYDPNSPLDFLTAYKLWGEFNLDDFDGRDISHMNVWARDPADVPIPEPATMALMGIGLLALAGMGRRKQKRA